MALRVYVFPRQYGDHAARVPALPGCGAIGRTPEEAVANARAAVERYREQTGVGSELSRAFANGDVEVVSYDGSGFFDEDDATLSSAEAKELAGRFADIVAEMDKLTAALMASQSEARPEGEWSVREIRDHLAEVEVRWLSRLDAITDGSFRVHDAVHEMVRRRIAALGDAQAGSRDVFGSRWTARRVVRRLLEHQFEHLEQIVKTVKAARGEAKERD